ncbi:MAG: hypothetical protein IJB69_02170 [Clostridia bacterium]|nr:hypothetical protein [Clostridia bacterium]
MRNTYADPTANTAIARVDRQRRLAEQKKKREEERLLRSLSRPARNDNHPSSPSNPVPSGRKRPCGVSPLHPTRCIAPGPFLRK